MHKQEIFRTIFFLLFFSVGALALGIAVLCDDFVRYYQNKQYVESARQSLEKIREINYDYDALISQIENDPNQLARLAPVTLGEDNSEPNTVYPETPVQQLASARKALNKLDEQPAEPVMPRWLSRSTEPQKRMLLYYSGIALVLISFVCFRPAKQTEKSHR